MKKMKHTAVKIENGNWSILDENNREIYRIQKHYNTRRSKNHNGYDKLIRLESGEYKQPLYFSHYATLKQALSSCDC